MSGLQGNQRAGLACVRPPENEGKVLSQVHTSEANRKSEQFREREREWINICSNRGQLTWIFLKKDF